MSKPPANPQKTHQRTFRWSHVLLRYPDERTREIFDLIDDKLEIEPIQWYRRTLNAHDVKRMLMHRFRMDTTEALIFLTVYCHREDIHLVL